MGWREERVEGITSVRGGGEVSLVWRRCHKDFRQAGADRVCFGMYSRLLRGQLSAILGAH